MEQWAEVRRLFFVRGLSQREIHRRTGLHRDTIRSAINRAKPPKYERAPSGSKLDPFKEEIQRLLKADARMPGQRIRELICELGFDGGKTIVDDYLREVRPLFEPPRTFQRTIYRPGEICQFDLWEPAAEVPVGYGQTRKGWVVLGCTPTAAAPGGRAKTRASRTSPPLGDEYGARNGIPSPGIGKVLMMADSDFETTTPARTVERRSRSHLPSWNSRSMHFVRHYTEMVVAMFLGMFALGMPLAALLGVAGVDVSAWQTDARELLLLGMAFTMSVPMAAWMRYRGHGWAPVWEMTGSMFVPSFAAIGLLGVGSVQDADTLLLIQHIGMFPSMLAVMLLRVEEYTGHGNHAKAAA